MYNVSEEYIEKINSLSKKVYWYGTVTLTNGTVYPFDTSNMSGGNTSITRELCNASSLKMGGTCSAELKISLMLDYDGEYYRLNGMIVNRYEFADAEVKLYFRLFLDDDDEENYEEIPMGSFIVSDTERKQLVLSLTAYDYMQKFGKTCISTIQGTPYNVLLGACAACGVQLGNSYTEIANMINGRKSVACYDPKNQISIWRDVIGYIAEMLGGNATIKSDNKLYIIPFKENYVREFTANNRVSLTLADYVSNYNALTATNLRNNTEDRIKEEDGGLTYSMGANPLMQYVTNTERQTVLSNLLAMLHDFDYVPFDGEFFCDPSIELGDVLGFSGNHAMELTKGIVTKIDLSISGHMKLACEGDNPYLATAQEAADRENAQNTGGSVGDGVTFYDYTNASALNITNEGEISSLIIDANGNYRNEFMAEILMDVSTTESLVSNVWQETDCKITITYYLDGVEVGGYNPQQSYFDGKHILHLYYEWTSDKHVESANFEVKLSVTGGTVAIGEEKIKSRIMQSGNAYPVISNEIAYIEVDKEPNSEMYWKGQPIDYTGVKIVAEYEDGRIVDITNQCAFSPANGEVVFYSNSINVDVSYIHEGKTFNTAFYMEEIVPDELQITPPETTVYYADIEETLDYTGLVVNCKFSDGTIRDVTAECNISPIEGTVVTMNTPTYVLVTYFYFNSPITDGFDIEVEEVEFDLKYFEYTKNDSLQRINITALNTTKIDEDKVKTLKVPDYITHPETGLVYQVVISYDN